MPRRVLLVDDHALIREGLAKALAADPDLVVAGEAATAEEALRAEERLVPDVALVDLHLGDDDGLRLVRKLRERRPDLGIVVITMHDGDDQLFASLEAGASAFVSKSAPSEDVLAAARHAAAAPRAFVASNLAAAVRRRAEGGPNRLTQREDDVLQLLAQGLPIAAIARQLYVSQSTAKTHVAKLYDKLGATNRAQALMTAVRLGLVRRDDRRASG